MNETGPMEFTVPRRTTSERVPTVRDDALAKAA